MANTDWSGLDWGLAASLVPMGRSAWDPDMDVGKAARGNFKVTDQNVALLKSLGFGGNATSDSGTDPETGASALGWTPEALQYLHDRGYSVGVGHRPGTSSGGRAEYWGLLDPSRNFVQGQSDPYMSTSDTLMDNIVPFLMMAGPLASAISTSAGMAGAAGSGLGASSGTLGAAADGLSALGSSWSPQALGLTGSVAPGVTAAELAGLSSALPGAVEVGAGLGAAGGLSSLGGGGSGLSSLGSAWSPEALGLTGGVAPGASAAEIAGITSGLPGAVAGPTAGAGAAGGLSSADKAALYGNQGYGPGMSGAQTSAYDKVLGATGSKGAADLVANSSLGSSLVDGVKSISDLVGGGSNLASLIGAGLGAASGGGTNTSTVQSQIDPRMAQYLYGTGYGDTNSLLGAAQQLWQQNKSGLNETMQQGLDMQRAALTDPAYGQSYTQMRNLGTSLMGGGVAANPFSTGQAGLGQSAGLLGQQSPPQLTEQPNAQAGGVGGLLGIAPDARALQLISRGRGLL